MNKDKLLRQDLAVYISNNSVTNKEILRIYYDDSFLNHFTRAQTENAFRKKYFSLSISFETEKYVRIYSDCQRVRVHHHNLYNEFSFILLNNKNLSYTVIVNFIINMPSMKNFYINKICDAILILMNKLIKYVVTR